MEPLDIRQFENRVVISGSSSNATQDLRIVSGSRMLVTLLVLSADPGAAVSLDIQNNFMSEAPFETLSTLTVAGVGRAKDVITDFHNLFRLVATVSGGAAEYRVAVSLGDSAAEKGIQLFTREFDTITAAYPSSTQEIFQSRIGGIGGPVQETVVINYVDSSKALILNVTRL